MEKDIMLKDIQRIKKYWYYRYERKSKTD